MQALGKVWGYIGGASQQNTPQKTSQEDQGFERHSESQEEATGRHVQSPARVKTSPKRHSRKKSKSGPTDLDVSSLPVGDIEVMATAEEPAPLKDDELATTQELEYSGRSQKVKRKRDRDGEGNGTSERRHKKKKRRRESIEASGEVVSLRRGDPVDEADIEDFEPPVQGTQSIELVRETPTKKKKKKKRAVKEIKPPGPLEPEAEHEPGPQQTPEPQRDITPTEYEVLLADSSEDNMNEEGLAAEIDQSSPQPSESSQKKKRTKKEKEREIQPRTPSTKRRRNLLDTSMTPVQVIIPAPVEKSHGNSKGIAPPPPPAEYERGPFTPEEDNVIRNVVDRWCRLQTPRLTRDDFIRMIWANSRYKTDLWNVMMINLPTRARSSLYARVRRIYNDFENGAVWTEEQDAELIDLVEEKGTKWTKIGRLLERMPGDCRDRWRNYLICGENKKKFNWSPIEEEKLLQALDETLTVIVDLHEAGGTTVLKGSDIETEEERKARLNEEKKHHREEIDWGIISQRMEHSRSRIQCLFKAKQLWRKIAEGKEEVGIKRTTGRKEATPSTPKRKRQQKDGDEKVSATATKNTTLKAAKKMLPGDYQFIMRLISVQGYDCLASIDWNKVADMDMVKHFTAEQFKAGFHKYMADNNPEKKDLRTFVAKQLEVLQDLPAMQRNKRYRPPAGGSQVIQTDAGSTPVNSSARTPKKTSSSKKPQPINEESETAIQDNRFYAQSTLDLIDANIGKPPQKKKQPSKSKDKLKAVGNETEPKAHGTPSASTKQKKPRTSKNQKIISPEMIEESSEDDGAEKEMKPKVIGNDDEIEDYDTQQNQPESKHGDEYNEPADGGSEADDEGVDEAFWG